MFYNTLQCTQMRAHVEKGGVLGLIKSITTYFQVFCQYSTYSQIGRSVGYPNQSYIYLYVIFNRANLKQYYLNSLPPKVFLYLYSLLICNCKFEITNLPQISLQNAHITFILLMKYQLFLTLYYPNSTSSILEQSRLFQTTHMY